MKKLLLVVAIAGFAACNNGTTENTVDSTAVKIDSTADAKIDSVQSSSDSIVNKLDSAADAKIDKLQGKADSTKN
jgi:peptidoglycan hydrolase CwlO-like protein